MYPDSMKNGYPHTLLSFLGNKKKEKEGYDLGKILDDYFEAMTESWEDEELYHYGLRQLKLAILNIATILICGYALGRLLEGIIFAIGYISMRKMSGGFHAKTVLRCYIYSFILYILALYAMDLMPVCVVYLVAEVIFFLLVLHLLPIENENKKLSETEKSVYKGGSVLVYSFLFIIGGIFYYTGMHTCYMAVATAIGCAELLIAWDLIQHRLFPKR